MAQQTTITYLDDIDGSKASETVDFAVDGARYSIDLSTKNAKALRKAVAEFIEHARPIKPAKLGAAGSGRRTSQARPTARTSSGDVAALRAWAVDNGIEVSPRGRISGDVRAQYEAATASQ
jgi:hypothetical protein